MKVEIDKGMNVHVCFQCKAALLDVDFNLCGIRVNADDPGICVDYICPKCNFNGRYTMSLIQAEPSFVSALESLKDLVCDQIPPPPKRRRTLYKRWERDSGSSFRNF